MLNDSANRNEKQAEWKEWRCPHCERFITEYNAAEPCHLRKRCKCGRFIMLDRRNVPNGKNSAIMAA